MQIVCSDLEGVFIPEIWINVAERTGIAELRLTTRDIADYDVLMKKRLSILARHHLTLKDITEVIATMDPLEGAVEFLDWLRSRTQVIVVSDTYEEFAGPLMAKLGRPTIFCHNLDVAEDGTIRGYCLRQPDAKRCTVKALKSLNYRVIAMGDSYNDINMIQAADAGVLFRPPENVIREYPELPVTTDYKALRATLESILAKE